VAAPLQEIFYECLRVLSSGAAAWLRERDLAPSIPAYVRRLVDRRYAGSTVRMYLYGVAHFAHWARGHQVDLRHLSDEVVRRFIDEHLPHCTCSSPVQRCPHQVRAALRQLLVTLVDAGGLISSEQPDAIEDQLQRFDSHMVHARGLAETTPIRRLGVIRALQRFRAADDPDATARPSARELRCFITRELSRISSASASSLAGACGQHFIGHPKAQWERKVEPHRIANHFGQEAEASISNRISI
jgi:hypothetical protein